MGSAANDVALPEIHQAMAMSAARAVLAALAERRDARGIWEAAAHLCSARLIFLFRPVAPAGSHHHGHLASKGVVTGHCNWKANEARDSLLVLGDACQVRVAGTPLPGTLQPAD